MALTSATRKVTYTGNGSTTAFAFAYLFFASSDLVVKVEGATKTLTTDYTVSGAGEQAGGTVTFGTAPASGASVTIERVVDFTQPTSFRTQGNYSPKVHENAFDKGVMQAQQLDARVGALEDADLITRVGDLEDHDDSEDAVVDLIDARVSALEAGDSPPAPTTEDYTGVAAAISARTAPTITRPADGSSLTAESLQTPLDVLADKVASILAHGGLLDVAGTWSAVQTFSAQPVMSPEVHYVGAVGEPAFQNGWGAPTGYGAPCFWKDAQGMVHLGGRLAGTTGTTVAFTLPDGYRPAPGGGGTNAISFFGQPTNEVRIIGSSGDVLINGTDLAVYLDGIAFMTDLTVTT